MNESQRLARTFLYRDAPVLGFALLYALNFLVLCVVVDVWEYFDPDKSQLNKPPTCYVFPLGLTFGWWFCGRRWAKRQERPGVV